MRFERADESRCSATLLIFLRRDIIRTARHAVPRNSLQILRFNLSFIMPPSKYNGRLHAAASAFQDKR